jgi:hypothetical protein
MITVTRRSTTPRIGRADRLAVVLEGDRAMDFPHVDRIPK